jgi:hypothetical protein
MRQHKHSEFTLMTSQPASLPQLESIQPLVRYVDEHQAVIETHFKLKSRVPTPATPAGPAIVDARIEIDGDDGFHDEHEQTLQLDDLHGMLRIDLVRPHRWWPATMGEQRLYEVTVSLMLDQYVADMRSVTIGLTSVRRSDQPTDTTLLVNGRTYTVGEIMPIDASDENSLLPIGGDSLIIVRDHYGPDILYQAADRAGILLVQCVPIDATGHPEQIVDEQVARLATHPSLAGWCVGHLGSLAPNIAGRLRALDPTHNVFTQVPGGWAA